MSKPDDAQTKVMELEERVQFLTTALGELQKFNGTLLDDNIALMHRVALLEADHGGTA